MLSFKNFRTYITPEYEFYELLNLNVNTFTITLTNNTNCMNIFLSSEIFPRLTHESKLVGLFGKLTVP